MRVGIVGAGIVGLANAWRAAEQGCQVTVFERSPRALGASIRNFGMIWPMGQPPGEQRELALRGRALWLELAQAADFWANPCGSLHLAHADDEQQVLAEFAAAAPDWGVDCELLDARQVLERTPAARPEQLRGGLWSPAEVCVNPRQALAQIPPWLHARHGVEFQFQTPVRCVEPGRLETAAGATWEFERILVASGHDFVTLFPAVFAAAGVRTCKLHMLRTEPQPEGWRIGPVLATGLTLRHYETFRHCPTLESLRQRIARETPHMDAYGIHVLLSQHAAGEVLLGDSHEYDERATPFRNELIDELILQEVDRCVRLPRLRIAERWQGYYAKLPGVTEFVHEPCPGVTIVLASGGAGMTMSLGYAERRWS